jgi:TolB-like protein
MTFNSYKSLVFLLFLLIASTLISQQLPYTGDGGKDIRISILVPVAKGLSKEQDYLPFMVQSSLVSDLRKFSAFTIIDLQKLETILKHTESGIYKSEEDYIQLGEIANVDYTLEGTITKQQQVSIYL